MWATRVCVCAEGVGAESVGRESVGAESVGRGRGERGHGECGHVGVERHGECAWARSGTERAMRMRDTCATWTNDTFERYDERYERF